MHIAGILRTATSTPPKPHPTTPTKSSPTPTPLINSNDNTVIPLERFERQLLLGLDPALPQLLNLVRKHLRGVLGAVDAVGLDGDDDAAVVLEEAVRVQGDDSGLVGLGNVGEDAVLGFVSGVWFDLGSRDGM